MARLRQAAVAGTFYPGSADALRRQVEGLFRHPFGPGDLPAVAADGPHRIVGLVCPHAGYIYSGPVAAHAYAALAADGRPDVVVLVGPNHYGLGPPVAISTADAWQTPLGNVPVERKVADALAAALPWPTRGEEAHMREHSLEVQLPFLQTLFAGTVPIVPIAMREQRLEVAQALGAALVQALAGRHAVVIASTDLSHYEPQASAMALDHLALNAMLASDGAGLIALAREQVSMCGAGPVAAALVVAASLGAGTVEVLKYATSGDVAGDKRQVVGYAALVLKK